MCPNCRAFITTSDKVCPYCGERVGARAIDRRQSGEILGGLIPQAHFTTVLILIVNAGLFAATLWLQQTMGEGGALIALGGKYDPLIFGDHQWWRLITAGFLHANFLHILMNSWALYTIGAQVEEVYSTPRYLVIYFVSTLAGFYLSAVENRALSIGASAAIMGLIGAMVAFGVANRTAVGRAIRNFYLSWIILNLVLGFIGSGIDNWAHLGGLAGGFAIGYLGGTPIRSSHAREAMWRALAALCMILTVLCFIQVYTHFPTPDQLH